MCHPVDSRRGVSAFAAAHYTALHCIPLTLPSTRDTADDYNRMMQFAHRTAHATAQRASLQSHAWYVVASLRHFHHACANQVRMRNTPPRARHNHTAPRNSHTCLTIYPCLCRLRPLLVLPLLVLVVWRVSLRSIWKAESH